MTERSHASRPEVRFLVVAFDRLSAAHLASLLREDVPDAEIVTAHSPADFEIVLSQPFQLVLLDTRNVENPSAVVAAFKPLVEGGCRLAVIVIDDQPERLRWALNARETLGFPHGIMPATMSPERCRAAIVHVATGHEYWTWARMSAHGQAGGEPRPAPEPVDLATLPAKDLKEALTPRETQILRLLKQGLRNKEVAERLAISVNTAKIHIASIKRKYRVSNRMQLL